MEDSECDSAIPLLLAISSNTPHRTVDLQVRKVLYWSGTQPHYDDVETEAFYK